MERSSSLLMNQMMITKNIFKTKFRNIYIILLFSMYNYDILLEEAWESAQFLLIGEKRVLHSDCCQPGMIQQPRTSPTMLGHRVFRSWLRFAGIPNQFLPCPLRFPLGRIRVAGWRIASLARICELKKSASLVVGKLTDLKYIGMNDTHSSLDNPQLSSAKIDNKSRLTIAI